MCVCVWSKNNINEQVFDYAAISWVWICIQNLPKTEQSGAGSQPFCVHLCVFVCVCERVTYCFIDAIRFYCLRFDSYAQFAAIWPQLASLFFLILIFVSGFWKIFISISHSFKFFIFFFLAYWWLKSSERTHEAPFDLLALQGLLRMCESVAGWVLSGRSMHAI